MMYTLFLISFVSIVVVASGEECDSCIDHYRYCVDRGIVDPDQPNVTIDCSVPDHQLRCPKRCGVCTPCDYVNQSEHDVAIQELQNEVNDLEQQLQEQYKTNTIQELQNEVNDLEKIVYQYINKPVLLTIFDYGASSSWPGYQVGLSVDNKNDTYNCFHTEEAPDSNRKQFFSEQYAMYYVDDNYVDQVKVLIRTFMPEKMESAYAQVCQEDGSSCQNCSAFKGVKGGEWATSDCQKKQGAVVSVRNDENQINICEIQIYGIPPFTGVL